MGPKQEGPASQWLLFSSQPVTLRGKSPSVFTPFNTAPMWWWGQSGVLHGGCLDGGGKTGSYPYHIQCSLELITATKSSARGLQMLQEQPASLVSVTFQNLWALNTLITEKGETYPFLNEECYYYDQQPAQVAVEIKNKTKQTKTSKSAVYLLQFWNMQWLW